MKRILCDLYYVFLNYFVGYIPCWTIRKFFYRCFGMKIGKGSRINMRCIVMGPWRIKIGENTIINEYSLLDGRGGLQIGDNTSISMWSVIYSCSHYLDSPAFESYRKPVLIGCDCWTGARSVLLPGSLMNDGSVVGANSVFKGTAVRNGVYIGIPASLHKMRDSLCDYKLENKHFFV